MEPYSLYQRQSSFTLRMYLNYDQDGNKFFGANGKRVKGRISRHFDGFETDDFTDTAEPCDRLAFDKMLRVFKNYKYVDGGTVIYNPTNQVLFTFHKKRFPKDLIKKMVFVETKKNSGRFKFQPFDVIHPKDTVHYRTFNFDVNFG